MLLNQFLVENINIFATIKAGEESCFENELLTLKNPFTNISLESTSSSDNIYATSLKSVKLHINSTS